MSEFARRLVRWGHRHGRKGLPWQGTRDPYRIWLSEVMLQQTQVAAVIPYYERFVARFPDVRALARASEEEVLRLWSGLGYYARARNLLAAARVVASRHDGRFPDSLAGISDLPGIGRSTAAAIAAFAFGRRAAILDGNVKRVLARCFGLEGEKRQWTLAESLLPVRGIGSYTQALMDLGATLCTRANPACERCPVASRCVARRAGRVAQLPAPRKRQALPLRKARWAILVHQRCVLLERRPSSGLWGGLWTFPEAGRADARALERQFGCRIASLLRLPPLEHGFTHFRLRVLPVLCEVRSVTPRAESSGRIWLDIAEATGAAVPAPVRKLLRELARRG